MKIPETKTNLTTMDGTVKAHGPRSKSRASRTGSASKSSLAGQLDSAKVKLSERANDLKKIRAAVDATPDVDEAKVAKYKDLINSGKYKVDSKAVADKMVNEHSYNDFFNVEE